jgi:nitrite reductase/ring-hydroxylating ferredoxin subunit
MTRIRVGRVEDLPIGAIKVVPYKRRGIAVINVNGKLHAINNSCPHQGAPLASGVLTGMTVQCGPYETGWEREGEILRCPWHRWEIDVVTGTTITEPRQKVPSYPVAVIDGEIFVEVTARRAAAVVG